MNVHRWGSKLLFLKEPALCATRVTIGSVYPVPRIFISDGITHRESRIGLHFWRAQCWCVCWRPHCSLLVTRNYVTKPNAINHHFSESLFSPTLGSKNAPKLEESLPQVLRTQKHPASDYVACFDLNLDDTATMGNQYPNLAQWN
jgi:hypothetical protein